MTRPPIPDGPYLVVGLARSGVAAASALRRRRAEVLGVDAGHPDVTARLESEGVEVLLDSDGLELLPRAKTVVKSPGVPEQAPVIGGAHARGVEVIGELELAWRMLGNETIAVTGTNGKTTTVELIAEIHRAAQRPVAAAGNVGLALSALVDRVDPEVTIVCETSSFQLQDSVSFAPQAAVLLNLAPDHLDRHGSYESYAEAKMQIFARQGEGDVAVLPLGLKLPGGQSARSRMEELGCKAEVVSFASAMGVAGADADAAEGADADVHAAAGARVGAHAADGAQADAYAAAGALWWRGQRLIGIEEMRIRGAHNVDNALAAAAVCLARGVDVDAVRAGLRSFSGVKHRLEEVRSAHGVLYVNDSKATNIASTAVALAAFPARDGRPCVHLILGGQGKGQDFSALRSPVSAACAAAYLIGEEQEQIAAALAGIDVPVEVCGDLESAVRRASTQARTALAGRRWVAAARGGRAPKGGGPHEGGPRDGGPHERGLRGGSEAEGEQEPAEVVLLSPGCASFDQFDSYEARGDRFKEIVAEL